MCVAVASLMATHSRSDQLKYLIIIINSFTFVFAYWDESEVDVLIVALDDTDGPGHTNARMVDIVLAVVGPQ